MMNPELLKYVYSDVAKIINEYADCTFTEKVNKSPKFLYLPEFIKYHIENNHSEIIYAPEALQVEIKRTSVRTVLIRKEISLRKLMLLIAGDYTMLNYIKHDVIPVSSASRGLYEEQPMPMSQNVRYRPLNLQRMRSAFRFYA